MKSYVVMDGVKKEAAKKGHVHQQMQDSLQNILQHFSIKIPLNFVNTALTPEVINPKSPQQLFLRKKQRSCLLANSL